MGKEHARLTKVRRVRPARWMSLAAASLLLAGAWSGAPASFSQPPVRAPNRQFSATEISALHRGAEKHPFATLAVLNLLRDTSVVRGGALYLECIPPDRLASLLLDSPDRDAIAALLGMLQWSPYSFSEYFVQVSWSVRHRTADEQLIEFRTKLLKQTGTFNHPMLESNTTVILRGGRVWFLAPAVAL